MKIPKQVEEAAELAEKLHSAMTTEEQAAPDGALPEETVEKESEPLETKQAAEEVNWEERYKHLQGKYEKEVPRLTKDIQELKQSIVEKLVSEKPVESVEVPPKNAKVEKFRSEYTEDFIEGLLELVKTEIDPMLKERFAPVEKKVTDIEQEQYESAVKEFKDYLGSQVKGDWQKLWDGEDTGFEDFKKQEDPSGLYTYGELLDLYNDKWQADKMAKIFNTYLGVGKTPEPVIPPKQTNPEKDALVAPNRSTTHVSPNVDEARIWTRDAIKEFEKADRAGKYSPEESKAMWDDLILAPAQNRIRP